MKIKTFRMDRYAGDIEEICGVDDLINQIDWSSRKFKIDGIPTLPIVVAVDDQVATTPGEFRSLIDKSTLAEPEVHLFPPMVGGCC